MAPDDGDGTWRYVWPAGTRLLEEIDTVASAAGRRVIDLGCGQGRLGRWALAAGAAEVVFADRSAEALAAIPPDPRARLLVHAWGEPLPPCDLLLGGDILYRPALHAALLASIASALVEPAAEALLADPRHRLESELTALAAAQALDWRPERRGTYTLVRIRRINPVA